uniref:Uncharacterized protein n=1 Tax=Chromera velia CCMP2878 TaxID=1169474 RepID=A0A0G4FLJ8_9ALVE|eukprot:Cvel_3461.t1-p1 / transcript=Cvel_3461.t1 / gene=Cvel_3461 / organism=Chromera_velia_CCMP2878 / gene_product=hypothetical protein / transcript_product=hypothetical protein / location=Cvel_scaffold139:106020-107209(+) / protein_length=169 / sequence_SO=supercontig / SO=protein_coding / is_pseudo=false
MSATTKAVNSTGPQNSIRPSQEITALELQRSRSTPASPQMCCSCNQAIPPQPPLGRSVTEAHQQKKHQTDPTRGVSESFEDLDIDDETPLLEVMRQVSMKKAGPSSCTASPMETSAPTPKRLLCLLEKEGHSRGQQDHTKTMILDLGSPRLQFASPASDRADSDGEESP